MIKDDHFKIMQVADDQSSVMKETNGITSSMVKDIAENEKNAKNGKSNVVRVNNEVDFEDPKVPYPGRPRAPHLGSPRGAIPGEIGRHGPSEAESTIPGEDWEHQTRGGPGAPDLWRPGGATPEDDKEHQTLGGRAVLTRG
ncbi:hypothetical protein L6452_37146 [Arctium lappa]|uniref:Uncharacterized protein n=1 Tax=Arctium lappa TaxID=4217 RepID=A0ACB8Y241_ARCLA|nr:hypothetical protein L6452_37146 [Arctium lappa]